MHFPPSLTGFDVDQYHLRDYGNLSVGNLANRAKSFKRSLPPYYNFELSRGYDDLINNDNNNDDINYYFAFDDDIQRNPFRHDIEGPEKKTCRRTSWHKYLFPNCNNQHEYDMQNGFLSGETQYLTEGAYREIYLAKYLNESVVFKTIYWDSDFDYSDIEKMRIDALVAERLTSSPRIVDIYGYCGTTMLSEALLKGDLYQKAAPFGHHGRTPSYLENKSNHLIVSNNLSPREKLHFALEMAEALADLHGFVDGVIVHKDIKPAQFLLTEQNSIKLNDFNRAEILLWDEHLKQYCPFESGVVQGVWRGPEEYNQQKLNEKIDIWSLGASIYVLLTGVKPHHIVMDNWDVLSEKLKKGEVPMIDSRFVNKSIEERNLVEFLDKCWEYDPNKRIDIFELVKMIRSVVVVA